MEQNSPNSNPTLSPEFEFNPSSQQTTLHSADQLFSGGILLPLRLLNTDDPSDFHRDVGHDTDNCIQLHKQIDEAIKSEKMSHLLKDTIPTTTTTPPNPSDLKTASKRWKDIFKKTPSETPDQINKKKNKKKERSTGSATGTAGGSTGGTGTAELNINLWPFSRSRSAGTIASRKPVTVNRKVSSAPCSRSNSTGRKWPSSPGRPGVHLGRSSPVWQAKRFGQSRSLHDALVRSSAEKSSSSGSGSGSGSSSRPTTGAGEKGKVMVPTCIGYRQRMSCQSDVGKGGGGKGGVTAVNGGGEGASGGSSLFNLRSLFTKKVF